MKILIFTEGTILMHKTALNVSREGRVRQVEQGDPAVQDFASYIPNGHAPSKIQHWHEQGADIWYLTSRTEESEINNIRDLLKAYKFPKPDHLLFVKDGETYARTAERLLPDVLIEDDCESIGGEDEMTYPHIKPDIQFKIRSVVVKEFEGIDHLPDNIEQLQS